MGRLRIKQRRNSETIRNLTINTSPENKMSELIIQYAGDFINMGENTEERQSYLNGACTAWNIANLDETQREEAILRVIADYRSMNSGDEDAENLDHDLRKLVQKKLEMFPNMKKYIVDAMIEPINEKEYKINIASTYDKELMKMLSQKILRHE
jgi:hypothetical protein